jgi:hypothetical protein
MPSRLLLGLRHAIRSEWRAESESEEEEEEMYSASSILIVVVASIYKGVGRGGNCGC